MIQRSTRRAFTLIELLLVLVILAVLAAVVVPKFVGTAERSRRKATIAQISMIKTMLDHFEVSCGRYPTTEEGLEALVAAPSNLTAVWEGPYTDKIPKDSWGNDFVYRYPGTTDASSYDLYSIGPDGQDGTEDDISKDTMN